MSQCPTPHEIAPGQASEISLVSSAKVVHATEILVVDEPQSRGRSGPQLVFGADTPLYRYFNQPLVLPGRSLPRSIGRVRIQQSSLTGVLEGRTLVQCAYPYDDGLELCTFRPGAGPELRRQLLSRAAEAADPARFLQQQEYNALEPEGSIGALLVGPREEFPEIFAKRTRRLQYQEPRTRWAVLPPLSGHGGPQDLESCLALLEQDSAVAGVAEQALQGWLYAPWLSLAAGFGPDRPWRLFPQTVSCSGRLLRFSLQRALCGPRSADLLRGSRSVRWLAIRIFKEQLVNENKHWAQADSKLQLMAEASQPGGSSSNGKEGSGHAACRRERSEFLWESLNLLMAEHGPDATMPRARMLLADAGDVEQIRCGLLLVGCLHHYQAIDASHQLFRDLESLVQDPRLRRSLGDELRLVAGEISENKRAKWVSLIGSERTA